MVTIYVLKLRQGKWYVGKTSKPTYRLDDHFSQGGSVWTKKYAPITIHELRPDRPATDEQIVTQEYMAKYGIDNVRGGPWCKLTLTSAEKQMITHINKGNTDSCYKCGSSDHFSSKCNRVINKGTTPSRHEGCARCGRKNHNVDNCYATTDIDGYELDSDDGEFGTYWEAAHQMLNIFEKFYCEPTQSKSACKRCGRTSHHMSNCYARTHAKGYDLY